MSSLLVSLLAAWLVYAVLVSLREVFGPKPVTVCDHCGGRGYCLRSCCTSREYASGQPCPGGACRECGGGE